MANLPVETVLPELKRVMRGNAAGVLVASPGAGKTTRVPLALLEEKWLTGRIIMLEPRRMAARAAAGYMAACLGETVGKTVGYRVRMDTCVSKETRIEVVTEGVLTRMLQADPSLGGVGLVIFDEFHERSLHADLGLALCLQSQAILREDLKLLVMSATLEAKTVAALLGNVPVIVSEGRAFPVQTRYLTTSTKNRPELLAAAKVQTALSEDSGDILLFLPGSAEIRRVETLLRQRLRDENVKILPLYGNLPQKQQDLALLPVKEGERKVVLATAIAETSLTVPGVRVVIDSGLMRVPRFSLRTGMTRLETVAVSAAAADQRRGRAGREGPGVCYRLWSEQENKGLEAQTAPEMLVSDLSSLALELAAWGISSPEELQWLDLPPAPAYAQAVLLLQQLGGLDYLGKITAHGRKMVETGLHPRLAHMVLKAIPMGLGMLSCQVAALLSQKDVVRTEAAAGDADLRLRLALLGLDERSPGKEEAYGYKVDWNAVRFLQQEAERLRKVFSLPFTAVQDDRTCGLLLAFAYPDRIAMQKGNGRFLLRNGRGAALASQQPLACEKFIVAAQLDDQGTNSRIFIAAPLAESEVAEYFREQIEESVTVAWSPSAKAVRARKTRTLGRLVLQEEPIWEPDKREVLSALLTGIRAEGLKLLPWTKQAVQFRQRLHFLHGLDDAWPDVSEERMLDKLEEWLAPYLYGISSSEGLAGINLQEILFALLNFEQRKRMDVLAPECIKVPSGKKVFIDYAAAAAPVLAVRLQEMFGLAQTPRIAEGKIPLTIHLLSPAGRSVQVTQDLSGFWREGYFAVKKDLKGRYPKHYWPDDPLQAVPIRGVRPQK
jgi:ATP-dependent helicase HrpB